MREGPLVLESRPIQTLFADQDQRRGVVQCDTQSSASQSAKISAQQVKLRDDLIGGGGFRRAKECSDLNKS